MGDFFYRSPDDDGMVILGYQSDDGQTQEARISMRYGANLCRYSYNGNRIIDYVPALLEAGYFTGTPVLYPTPNRVANGVFSFKGQLFDQVKHGRRILEHGLVHDEAWELVHIGAEQDSACLIVKIDWNNSSHLFAPFPFEHTLTLSFNLFLDGVEIAYKVANNGASEIPFGFGLHPYFQKLSDDEGTYIQVPVQYVMDATKELLPTGKIFPVAGTDFDLDRPSAIGKYDLDHVFIRSRNIAPAMIEYVRQGLKVEITASEEFSYFVVYSPQGEPYFCIEEQTCSTDAHNLYDRGLKKESGLQIVQPGAEKSGSVRYTIKSI